MAIETPATGQDPFGDLSDWGRVLEILEEMTADSQLDMCQPGLVRILRYKGNWRLREEVLKRMGGIEAPSTELIDQTLRVLADDNIYYDARVLAANALMQMLGRVQNGLDRNINLLVRQATARLRTTPQPLAFDNALKKLHSEAGLLAA